MSFINHPDQLAPAAAAGHSKLPIWQRMLDAVQNAQREQTEQIWSDIIARNGGRLTDDVERQIGLHV